MKRLVFEALALLCLFIAADVSPAAERKRLGYRELADLTQSGVRYAASAFLTRRQFLSDDRPRMEGFMKALIEAIHYTKTDRQGALKILSRYTRLPDLDILALSYDEYAEKVWARVPEIQPDDIKLILEHLGETNPKALEINPSDLIDTSILAELVKSGFVDRLYERPARAGMKGQEAGR